MSNWFDTDFDYDSKVLLISMGHQFVRREKFDWKGVWTNMHKDLNFKKMYISDSSRSWWHATKEPEFNGGHGPIALSEFIKDKIDEADVSRTYIMGSSMGGYGGILIGALININEVFAYSPQTYLTKQRYKKTRLNEKFKDMDIDYSLTNLVDVLKRSSTNTLFHIYYPMRNKSDVVHIKRIEHLPNIKLYPIDTSSHIISKKLVKDGTITKILKRITK